MLALAAAAELHQVNLADALELTLVLAAKDADRFPRAAARWHARFILEAGGVGLTEAQFVLAALSTLPTPAAPAALHGLEALFRQRQRQDLIAAVERSVGLFGVESSRARRP